jgi:hypothetical protein
LESINPSSPVPPYTPVTISISTNELSECKFNLNSAGGKFQEMQRDFGIGFAMNHTIILNLPGQTTGIFETDPAYPLITSAGNYTLYVRCIDAGENGEAAKPFEISFEVMQYPDTAAPFLSDFTPVSGSPIKYNTTTKSISFKMTEPAECKWSLGDKNFELMENNFSCTTQINTNPLDSYGCSGVLRNITTNLSERTKFYIKCKDQPWIAGGSVIVKGVNYSRNAHDSTNDYEYYLRPSEYFEILEVAPSGNILVSAANNSVELRAITSGGGANGMSTCKWRLSNNSDFAGSTFHSFYTTGSNIHRQTISNRSEGTYYAGVRCNDSAENADEKNISFNLAIDREAPFVTRLLYDNKNKLEIITNEAAMCYMSIDNMLDCIYEFANATLMTGAEKVHTATWQNDKNFYIRCKDYLGNENNGCAIIARTYKL